MTPGPGRLISCVGTTSITATVACATSACSSAMKAKTKPSWRFATTSTARPGNATRHGGLATRVTGHKSVWSPSIPSTTRLSPWPPAFNLFGRKLRESGDNHPDARRSGRRPLGNPTSPGKGTSKTAPAAAPTLREFRFLRCPAGPDASTPPCGWSHSVRPVSESRSPQPALQRFLLQVPCR